MTYLRKGYYRGFHRSLSRRNRRFHSLLVRLTRHLNLRHGQDRVWSMERTRLGRWKGWDHKVVTPQFAFAWTWKAGTVDVSGRKVRAESGSTICGTPWGGNVGWPRWSDDHVMSLLEKSFFETFSDHPAWWSGELPYFPFTTAGFSSAEDLELQMEVNGI